MRQTKDKRGSDSSSSQGSRTPNKKSSVCSVEALSSPPLLHKRVVRLKEYEEGDVPMKTEKVSTSKAEAHHSHNLNREKMEMRVKEELEMELSPHSRHHVAQAPVTTERGEEPSNTHMPQNWSKSTAGNSPLHSSSSRQYPTMDKWGTTESRSNTAATATPMQSLSYFSPPPPPSPTSMHSSRSGFLDGSHSKTVSHSDSNEWTEFACASVSGSSEVGNRVYSSQPSSAEVLSVSMSEFDPIRSSPSTSSAGDPSKIN